MQREYTDQKKVYYLLTLTPKSYLNLLATKLGHARDSLFSYCEQVYQIVL